MCDVGLNELCRLMAVQEARIRGRSQCFENDQEVCTVLPMLYNVNLPIMVTNLKLTGREVPKPMVRVIVPSLIKANNELLPPLIATLGNPVLISTDLVNPVISPLPPPLLLATTTPPPPLPLPVESEVEKNESTTANPVPTNYTQETTTTTSTTTTTTTTETSSQVAPIEIITTTAPTTTTTSTTTPKPNETLPVIVELQDPNPPDTPVNQTDIGVAQDEASALVPPVVLDPLQQDLERERERERERELERDLDHEAVAKTEYETVEYIPNLVQPPVGSDALTPPPSKANALEEDSESVHSNSVHAEYPHAAQSLQIPEEPPEE